MIAAAGMRAKISFASTGKRSSTPAMAASPSASRFAIAFA